MSWRNYQATLKRRQETRRIGWFALKWAFGLTLAATLAVGIVLGVTELSPRLKEKERVPPIAMRSKAQVRELMQGQKLWQVAEEPPAITRDGKTYEITTTLDLEFQRHMLKVLDPTHARAIAFVAMEPETGKVLVMAGIHKDPEAGNPCAQVLFPAASVFKMVTAAAVLDSKGLTPQSPVKYNGKKHTLYKSQLENRDNKYTRHITLGEAFSDSINSVFGKIGNQVGSEALLTKAVDMGFNGDLGLECAFSPSQIIMPEDAYGVAEVASGFNRGTRITAMHGAAMACSVVNGGLLPEPYIVASVENEESQIVYEGRLTPMGQAMTEKASQDLQEMMVSAALTGTGKGSFGKRERGRALKNIVVGGKTGSINHDTEYDIRYDWFVGFAHDQKNKKALAFAAIVAHEKFIGKKAGDYCKEAIKYYFK
ncbi:MAG: hypothetical protein JEZ02_17545 [Desulfatibacillum sp.]|nr:hypothetical protein [Desulfatibacillum sp.]